MAEHNGVKSTRAHSRKPGTEVIVVGCGLSGGMAAIEAADAGAKVIVIEKTEKGGGCAKASTAQLSGACSKLQIMAGVRDDPMWHYADCLRIGEFENDARLLKLACENAGPMIDWLYEHGTALELAAQTGHEAYAVPRTCGVPLEKAIGNGGLNLFYTVLGELEKRVRRGDVKLHFETRVVALTRDGQGRLNGVRAVSKDGKARAFQTSAVVLATGGFGGNARMVAEFNPRLKNVVVFPWLADFATGEGMLMAKAVGAGLTRKAFTTGYPGGIEDPEHPGVCAYICGMKRYPGPIWVDINGRRFVNENTPNDTERENACVAVPDCTVWVIFDRKVREENKPIVEGNFVTPGLDWEAFEHEVNKGRIGKRASTIQELANQIGIDDKRLTTTIEKYNSNVANGKDPEFGRQELKYCIENPPFYAIKTTPRLLSGMPGDGIMVNEAMQVLSLEGKVIPGLYACGDAIGTAAVSGKHPCAGFALTPAMIFGRIAGARAATERFLL